MNTGDRQSGAVCGESYMYGSNREVREIILPIDSTSSKPLDDLVHSIQQGWQMGEKAELFLAQKWEEHWEKPLSEWRTELRVEPV